MAGAKPGERRGGRKKGTPNKKTADLLDKIIGSGMTPLEFLVKVMREEMEFYEIDEFGERKPAPITPAMMIDAAKAAAPYVHAKRTQIEGTGEGGAIKVVISGVDAKL